MAAVHNLTNNLYDVDLDQMEYSSLARYYKILLDQIKANPKEFTKIVVLELSLCNFAFTAPRSLAKEYLAKEHLSKFEENTDIYNLAKKFAEMNAEHVIGNINIEMFKCDDFVNQLANLIKKYGEAAYLLAQHRKINRENSFFLRRFDENNSVEKLSMLFTKIKLNNGNVIAPVVQQVEADNAEAIVDNALPSISVSDVTGNHQPPTGPQWLVPEDICRALFSAKPQEDDFIPDYLFLLFDKHEFILPLKKLPESKKSEFVHVMKQLYGDDQNRQNAQHQNFVTLLNKRRKMMRKHLSKKLDDGTGYGVANNNIGFFYKLQKPDACFPNEECKNGSKLATHKVGVFEIPLNCGNFSYIFFFEKCNRRVKIAMLKNDGNITFFSN